ncbi:MAG: toprim domain-containing protein [Bacteroidota bacterium]
MNSSEAKKLSLPDIMAHLGYEPIKVVKNGLELWYNSPFRAEKAPSFHTSFLGGKWIWNDFGDKGGTVIDFVMRHENYFRISQALQFLERFENAPSKNQLPFSFQQQSRSKTENIQTESFERELEFISASKIQNPLIFSYLIKERAIDKKAIVAHLQEVTYKNLNNWRTYFAFDMKNQSGGYEIRAASSRLNFKSALIRKDVSLILQNGKELFLFEGMTDFLSYLTIKPDFSSNALILHSTKLLQRAISIIEQHSFDIIHGYLDNDSAGQSASNELKAKFGTQFIDQRTSFASYKDLNEWLVNQSK